MWSVPFAEIADLMHARMTGAGRTWGEAQARMARARMARARRESLR
jgi:hypothetical protein